MRTLSGWPDAPNLPHPSNWARQFYSSPELPKGNTKVEEMRTYTDTITFGEML